MCASKSVQVSNTINVIIILQLLLMLASGVGMSLVLTRTTPAIKKDIIATRFSFTVGACIALVAYVMEKLTSVPLQFLFRWWTRVFQFVVTPLLIVCGLCLHQVPQLCRNKCFKIKGYNYYCTTSNIQLRVIN